MRAVILGAIALSVSGASLASDDGFTDLAFAESGPSAAIYFDWPLGAAPRGFSSLGLRFGLKPRQLFETAGPRSGSLLQSPFLDARWFFNGSSLLELNGMPLLGRSAEGDWAHAFRGEDGGWNLQLISIAVVGAISAGVIASCLSDNWPCESGGGDDNDGNDDGGGVNDGMMQSSSASLRSHTTLTEAFFLELLEPRHSSDFQR